MPWWTYGWRGMQLWFPGPAGGAPTAAAADGPGAGWIGGRMNGFKALTATLASHGTLTAGSVLWPLWVAGLCRRVVVACRTSLHMR